MAGSKRAATEAGARQEHLTFADGARDIAPIIIATIPFGIVYGALAAKTGLSLVENLLMSALVFAGTSQFVALEFWADPLPVWTILFSVIAVNLRLVLYSAALGRKIEHWSPVARYTGFAFLTDPTLALAELRGGSRIGPAYYFGISVPLYVNWLFASWLGAAFGNLITRPEAIGLDFVVTAYFLFMIVGFRRLPNAAFVIGASAAGSLVLHHLVGSPWSIAAGALAGMIMAAVLARPGAAA